MSENVDPFSMTIRMILIKYAMGFIRSNSCAHSGILSIDVNNPLIKIKITIKKNDMSIDCCCVFVIVEISNPKPKITKR